MHSVRFGQKTSTANNVKTITPNLDPSLNIGQQAETMPAATINEPLQKNLTDADDAFKAGAKSEVNSVEGAWQPVFRRLTNSISFRLRNPMSSGPATRARHIMKNALITGAWTGGLTHFFSRLALEQPVNQAVAHLPGWLEHLTSNQQAAVIGGTATVAASAAAWLTGLLTSKGRDRLDYELAKQGKLIHNKLDNDLPEDSNTRRDAAKIAELLDRISARRVVLGKTAT
jgi:hypothetical protein